MHVCLCVYSVEAGQHSTICTLTLLLQCTCAVFQKAHIAAACPATVFCIVAHVLHRLCVCQEAHNAAACLVIVSCDTEACIEAAQAVPGWYVSEAW